MFSGGKETSGMKWVKYFCSCYILARSYIADFTIAKTCKAIFSNFVTLVNKQKLPCVIGNKLLFRSSLAEVLFNSNLGELFRGLFCGGGR